MALRELKQILPVSRARELRERIKLADQILKVDPNYDDPWRIVNHVVGTAMKHRSKKK